MLKHYLILPFLLFAISCTAIGQSTSQQSKRALDHADFDQWKSISGAVLTPDGSHLVYGLNPQEGDGGIMVRNLANRGETFLERGKSFRLNYTGTHLIYLIDAPYADQRQARIDGKRLSEVFDDTLVVYHIPTGGMELFAEIDSYKMPERSGEWLAFRFDRKLDSSAKDSVEVSNGSEAAALVTENDLIVYHLPSGDQWTIHYVDEYFFTRFGERLVYTTLDKDSLQAPGVHVLDLSTRERTTISAGLQSYRSLAMDSTATRIAFLAMPAAPTDTSAVDSGQNQSRSGATSRGNRRSNNDEPSFYSLFYWSDGMNQAEVLADTSASWFPAGQMINQHARPNFSHSGERLFFGTANIPLRRDTTVASIDVADVDIWNWQDHTLQTVQLVQLNQSRRQTHQVVYHINDNRFVPLEDATLENVTVPDRGDASYGFGVQNRHYMHRIQWEGAPVAADWYRVNIRSGERTPIAAEVRAFTQLSPEGRFLLWFDLEQQRWMSFEFATGEHRDLTRTIDVPFGNELNDVPNHPRPYGIEGWARDDSRVLLRDRYDIWVVDPSGSAASYRLTGGLGRSQQVVFRTIDITEDGRHIPHGTLYLSAFYDEDKSAGVYRVRFTDEGTPANEPLPTRLWRDDVSASGIAKARNADVWTIRKGTFQRFPDVYITDSRFNRFNKVTHANPQQDQYLWGDVELFTFNSLDGVKLEGLLYTPENFDPSRTYPMIVYFYERTSNRLHNYRAPAPSASTITPAFYTSRGYIVAMPDIVYKEGNPGRSAEDAVIGMTLHLLDRGFVDRERIGLQGQSWGGYQIAHIITRTDMFAAAMAGAPVSNMISAYGGIRWASGLNRQFQYERTQSRIGGTLWERPMYYIENSPIFFADRVRTPLLMMHNDADGAVPWYQGIEFFVALKRLDQPVWMLNYNGEAHNLRERVNRKDLSRRMQQFFDHYLMDAPMPVWMKYGVPAVEKGVNQGFDLVE